MGAASIRVRLTLWYGGMFLLAGFLLLAINFVLTSRNFPSSNDQFRDDVAARLGIPRSVLDREEAVRFDPRPGRGPGRLAVGAGELLDNVRAELRADTLDKLLVQSSVALLAMSMLSLGAGWWIAGRMLRPIREITETARSISEARLNARVGLGGPDDELRELADQFDVMLDRIEGSFEAQRAFVSNASHELRTPLAIMRTELDVTSAGEATDEQWRETSAVLRRAVDRSEELIDGLLLLARADSPRTSRERVAVDELARAALGGHSQALDARGITVSLELAPTIVEGDRVLLERLLENLVSNAVRHNVAGGTVGMRVAIDAAGRAVVRVENSGASIEEGAVEALFERFARGPTAPRTATEGHGLGLAIVRAVAEHHGGTATASARPGGGLTVEVRLPAAG